mmetsp:Transcript_59479/g.134272  ORF Transcript_59479/g.134272 Transcript_59479/m.134272 type:complete len:544 (+) Transcript_59479:63-1694(+)
MVKLATLQVFAAGSATLHPARHHVLAEQRAVVDSAGTVVSLAREQALFWRNSGKVMAELAAGMNATRSAARGDVDAFINHQTSSGDACHAKAYRYSNLLNKLHSDANAAYAQEKTLVEMISGSEEQISDLEIRHERLEAQFKKRLEECKQQKEEACAQHEMYTKEADELTAIGMSPSNPITLYQNVMHQAARRGAKSLQLMGLRHHGNSAALVTRRVVAAARTLQACLAKSGGQSGPMAALQLGQDPFDDREKVEAEVGDQKYKNSVTYSPEQCEEERKELEQAWRKAYMVVTSLVEETGKECNSTACEDLVAEQRATELPPLHAERTELVEQVRKAQKELQTVQEKVESLDNSITKVEREYESIKAQCGAVEEGSEYLEKVRKLLEELRLCPGLRTAVFTVPHFRLSVDVPIKLDTDDDAATDLKLQEACVRKAQDTADNSTIRAANHTELEQRLITGLPAKNTDQSSVMGRCPECAGKNYPAAMSQHLRKCFKEGSTIDKNGTAIDCGPTGHVLAVCVVDLSLADHVAAQTDATSTTTAAP